MAAKPISKIIIDKVLSDHRTGEYSARELAKKHAISLGKVGQIIKGVDKDCERIVNAGVIYRKGLSAIDERTAQSVNEVVDRKLRIKDNVEKFVESAVKKGLEMMKNTDSGADFKAIVEGVDKSTITIGINERHAKPGNVVVGGSVKNPLSSLSDEDLMRELEIVRDRANRIK